MRRRGTATGMPATWAGYWLGRLLCKLGLHKRAEFRLWPELPERRGDVVMTLCLRDCQWAGPDRIVK